MLVQPVMHLAAYTIPLVALTEEFGAVVSVSRRGRQSPLARLRSQPQRLHPTASYNRYRGRLSLLSGV
jgi:hypothetical protein